MLITKDLYGRMNAKDWS